MIIHGVHPIEALLQQHPKQLITLYILEHTSNPRLQKIIDLAKKQHIKITFLSKEKFFLYISKDTTHQGILAEVQEEKTQTEDDLIHLIRQNKQPLFLILDGIQDPHNLGACLRSANAAGVTAVIVPKDKAAGLNPTVRKVACGAEQFTPFISVTNLARTLRMLKEEGIWLIGLEGQADQSLYQMDMKGPLGLVLGSEGSGLRRLTKEVCDYLVHIPMQGQIDSLNVSNACAVALFEALRQRIAN